MKKTITSRHRKTVLFSNGVLTISLALLLGTGISAQVVTPTGTVGTSSTGAPYGGAGITAPKAMWEVQLQCASVPSNPLGGIVVTDDQNYICPTVIGNPNASYTKGDNMMYLRKINSLSPVETPFFVVRTNTGLTGVGIKAPLAQFHVKSLATNNVPFRVDAYDGTIDMMIDKNKNVGIGNSSTFTAKLHINNMGGSNSPLQIDFDGGEYTYGLLYKYWGSANYHKAITINNAAGKDVFVVHSNGYTVIGDMGSCTSLPQYGVADPGYKLVVDNGIITEKVKVAVACSADWSDYVFADTYTLPTVQEVAAYIQQNKHLPGMPSAGQMVETGNNLGQTDALLLKQIEELWLHSIEQQKRLDEMAALQKRTEELEAMVKKLAGQNQALLDALNANK